MENLVTAAATTKMTTVNYNLNQTGTKQTQPTNNKEK